MSSLVAYQTTSIHQHKSAQRGANCIRRPSLFLSGGACVSERERVCRPECRERMDKGIGKKCGLFKK